MFARDLETKELFQTKWNEIITRRGYRALVEGTPRPDRDTIRSYLVETRTHMIFSGAPGPGAKEAVTNYQVLKSGGGYSLLDISIDTGRKNQIRVHMKELGLSLIHIFTDLPVPTGPISPSAPGCGTSVPHSSPP